MREGRLYFLCPHAGTLIQHACDRNRALVRTLNEMQADLPEVYRHTRQVTMLAADIATELGLPTPIVYRIGKAAIYHDMGKLDEGIKPLVAAPRRLSEEERRIIHRHVRLSARQAPSNPIIQYAIYSHHEYNRRDPYDRRTPPGRFTGIERRTPSGLYPALAGQILAVADILQALAAPVDQRAYRPVEEYSAESIVEQLRAGFSGDPRLAGLAAKRLVA